MPKVSEIKCNKNTAIKFWIKTYYKHIIEEKVDFVFGWREKKRSDDFLSKYRQVRIFFFTCQFKIDKVLHCNVEQLYPNSDRTAGGTSSRQETSECGVRRLNRSFVFNGITAFSAIARERVHPPQTGITLAWVKSHNCKV